VTKTNRNIIPYIDLVR